MIKDFSKAVCEICGTKAHFLESHLNKIHGMAVEDYLGAYPNARVLSAMAEEKLAEIDAQFDNEKADLDVKKLFKLHYDFGGLTTKAFKRPHATTPKVDPDYSFRKEHLKIVLYSIAKEDNPQRVLFSGPTGSGKTSIIEQVAARLNWGYYRIAFDGDVTRADFIGQWTLKSGEMVWQDGILPRAMREGAMLCLDEWDCVNPSVGMVLQSVLEGKPLTILETAEILEPHEDFRIFATANTIGQGDTTGLYNGTQPQNFATLDRFSLVGIVEYPTKQEEEQILKKKLGLADKKLIDKFLETARLMREAFMKGQTVATMSTRTIINIAEKMIDFGDVKPAYELAYLNKLNPEDKAFGYEIMQRVWAV